METGRNAGIQILNKRTRLLMVSIIQYFHRCHTHTHNIMATKKIFIISSLLEGVISIEWTKIRNRLMSINEM